MPAGLAPHKLKLNLPLNMPVVLPRNPRATRGRADGIRFITWGFQRQLLDEVRGGHQRSQELASSHPADLNDITSQFPFLAFTLTIDKCQGQTVQHARVVLAHRVLLARAAVLWAQPHGQPQPVEGACVPQ